MGDTLCDCELLCVCACDIEFDWEAVGLSDGDLEDVREPLAELLNVCVTDGEREQDPVTLTLCVTLRVPDSLDVIVCEGVAELDAV